jgi:hypothetical protein
MSGQTSLGYSTNLIAFHINFTEWQNYFPNEATMLKFGEAGTAQPAKLANTDQIIVVSYEELRSNVKKFK